MDGSDADFRHVNGHIVIAPDALDAGENTVEISFRAGEPALHRNPEFLYTLFVPALAHTVFPVFDQPDLKARYTLDLTVPADWLAVSNGAEASREPVGDRIRIGYGETAPIPTYLFAFAAGRFQTEEAERGGRAFRMFHRETDTGKVERNRDAVFDLHATALEQLEAYTGIPYPFGKFEFVLIPAFEFGGMEHPGSIYYRDSGILLDESATQAQLLRRASLIAHETAHMWFGDLVTMRWFNDVWMKEVFANFMAGKIVNPSFPDVNHDLLFLTQNYPVAYGVDRTGGTHSIRQELDNLNEAGSLYGAIIYQKAPIVMRQLERILGEDTFREGIRSYLSDFQFANATWLDLIERLDTRTPIDLAAWSRAWVEEPGRPMIETELATDDEGRISSLTLVQSDPAGGARPAVDPANRSPGRFRRHVPDPSGRTRPGTNAHRRRRVDTCGLRTGRGRRSGLRRDRARRGEPSIPARSLHRTGRPARARRRMDHALGRDARWTRGAWNSDGSGP